MKKEKIEGTRFFSIMRGFKESAGEQDGTAGSNENIFQRDWNIVSQTLLPQQWPPKPPPDLTPIITFPLGAFTNTGDPKSPE